MSKKIYNIIDDGYNAELVEQTLVDGTLEIPSIEAPAEIRIPDSMTPFTKRSYAENFNTAICEYEHDARFADLIYATQKYVDDLKRFSAFVTPDCSLYRDMPLCLQIANTYFNRAIGVYLRSKGIYVITNIRWGTKEVFLLVCCLRKLHFSVHQERAFYQSAHMVALGELKISIISKPD